MTSIAETRYHALAMRIPKRKPGKYAEEPADAHLTAAAIRQLKDELERLEKHVRPKAVEELRRTREMGDLSENFAYTAAKAKVGGLDHRIFSIKERLKQAILITPGAGPGGTVRIGATVEVEVGGKRKTYQITGSQETDPAGGRISHLSPLGAALMNRKAGDVAAVNLNGRTVEYKIIEVR